MAITVLLLVLGFILLIKGADWLINGASSLATKYKVPEFTIGLTIVAFGTSAPELVVNVFAALQNQHELLLGNVIGSNNFNIFVILGIAGVIMPLSVKAGVVWKEIPISCASTLILLFLANEKFGKSLSINRFEAILLLAFFALFIFYVIKQFRQNQNITESGIKTYSNLKVIFLISIGLVGLVAGGKLIINNAIEIAQGLGVSEKAIGLTIIAAGTSLPELATSVVAAIKKNSDIAVGNILGSNVFNIFFVLGISAFIKPVDYNNAFNSDLLFLLAGNIVLFLAMFTGKKHKLDRWEALLLIILYCGYAWYVFSF
jgi:cation:H+ antiporter